MKKIAVWIGLLPALLISGFAAAGGASAATATCGDYRMDLRGETDATGVVYREHVVLEKLEKAGGPEGRWKLVLFEQELVYPGPIPAVASVTQRVDLKLGYWMEVEGTVSGNVVKTRATDGNVVLDVVGNRIGARKTDTWCGTIRGSEVLFKWGENNPLEPLLEGKLVLGGGKTLTLDVTRPAPGARYVFSRDTPGEMTITAAAAVQPEEYQDRVVWTFDEIPGVDVTYDPPGARGAEVSIRLSGLPAENDGFGEKRISARLEVDGCELAASREVRLFYPQTAENNPGGEYPNWFYYWKQTPAARPSGDTIRLEYGARRVDLCKSCQIPMLYKPIHSKGTSGFKMITVCDLSSICVPCKGGTKTTPFSYTHPLLRRAGSGAAMTGKFEGWRTLKHIDLFACALIHEYTHYIFDFSWRYGKSVHQVLAADGDGDGIPDHLEKGLGFDAGMKQTYLHTHPILKALEYDEEWLAYEAMYGYRIGTYDPYDWGRPGKQWP